MPARMHQDARLDALDAQAGTLGILGIVGILGQEKLKGILSILDCQAGPGGSPVDFKGCLQGCP